MPERHLSGGSSNDILIGGSGNDVYQITDMLDTITEDLNGTLGGSADKSSLWPRGKYTLALKNFKVGELFFI